jgi:GntR family transcriptional regulator
MNVSTIDRQSVTPYYQQLVNVLESRISSGELDVGQRLPSENDLCTEFGLSRATVRQALQQLERRGSAQRIPGRGVFVTEGTEPESGWVIQGREGFLENAIRNGNRDVSTRVISHGPVKLSAVTARLLDVAEGAEGYELVRVRSIDGTPALYSINRLSPPLVPVISAASEVLDGTGALTDAVERAGYSLGGAQRTIRTDSASGEIALALQVRDGSPLLHIRSTSWTPEGERFDVYETWVRSEIIPLEINVGVVPLPRGI